MRVAQKAAFKAGSSLRHWPPGTNSKTFVPSFFVQSGPRECLMRNWIKRRWILAMVVAAATVVSYAQWSNPADDVPAYHPSAPLKFAPLPPIMSGNKLTGENFRFGWQVQVYQQVAKVSS